MNLTEIQKYTTDEERAEKYLRKQEIIRRYDPGLNCKSTRKDRYGTASSNVIIVGLNGAPDTGVFLRDCECP